MDNPEEVLQYLNEFDRTAEKSVTPELEQLLEHIAKTGRTVFPWHLLKPLISFKLEKVLNDFFESNPIANPYLSEPITKMHDFYPIVQKLIGNLNCFSGIPFTIQRLCELITQPRKHYRTSDKFLRGVEKNLMVVSTVQPDGSLITRSLKTVLMNGTISPTETAPINSAPSTANNPVQSSPLNTNFQENGSSQVIVSAVVPSEEKPQTLCEDSAVNSNDQVNGSQHKDVVVEKQALGMEELKCEENGEMEKDIENDEKVALAAVTDDSQNDGEDSNKEQSSATEKPSKVESDEKPTDDLLESEKEEKMDES